MSFTHIISVTSLNITVLLYVGREIVYNNAGTSQITLQNDVMTKSTVTSMLRVK